MPVIKSEHWEDYQNRNCVCSIGRKIIKMITKVMEYLDEDDTPLRVGVYPDENTFHYLLVKADKELGINGLSDFHCKCIANVIMTIHSRGKEVKSVWKANRR